MWAMLSATTQMAISFDQELDLSSIQQLWDTGDIQLTDNCELKFSDALVKFVDNDFLKRVFEESEFLKTLSSTIVDLSSGITVVQFFDFERYPQLNAKTPELLFSYCPDVFNFADGKSYTFLTRKQFCDDELKVDGESFPCNRWFIEKYCGIVWHIRSEHGHSVTDLPIQKDIDIQTFRDALDCFYGNPQIKEKIATRSRLPQLLKAATFLDIPKLITRLDHQLSRIASKKFCDLYGRIRIESDQKKYDAEAITFLSEIEQEFCEFFNSRALPKTSDALKNIATELFRRTARRIDRRPTTFQDILNAFELLGPQNCLSHFSLFETYHTLRKMAKDTYRNPAVLSSYQTILETCIRYNPCDSAVLEVLQYCHQWGTDPDKYVKAKKALDQLRVLSPNPATTCTLAQLLFSGAKGVEKEPEKAMAMLENAIEQKPTSSLIYVTYAHLLRKSGKSPEAISLLRQFEDRTKTYSQLEKTGPYIIWLYSLYQRALNGEQFTYEQMKTYWEHSPIKNDYFLQAIIPVIVRGGNSSVSELSELFSNFQSAQFECTYPLIVEAFFYYSQEAKKNVLSLIREDYEEV
jgi:tetratricopeptide (TPR) repeat protein